MMFDGRDIKMSKLFLSSYETQRFIQARVFKDTLWPFINILGYIDKLDYKVKEV